LLDNAPDAIYVQTKERIAYVNRATLQLLRAERPEQLLGQPVLDLVARNGGSASRNECSRSAQKTARCR